MSDTVLLSKDQILTVVDMTKELVEIPEWGGSVYVKCLNGAERDAFEASCIVGRGARRDVNFANMRAKLCAKTIVDEQGNLLFAESDIAALSQKSAMALERIFEVAQRLSGLRKEDMDELAKNSEPGQNGNFTSV